MSDALRAASVASATAIPMSAFFKAGASFTPSPVMPQMCFLSCNLFTISYLCSAYISGSPIRNRHVYSLYIIYKERSVYFTGEDAGEAVGLLDEFVDGKRGDGGVFVLAEEGGRRVHVASHAEPSTGLFTNGKLVAGDHLNVDSQLESLLDGVCAVVSWRIEERQESHKLPWSSSTLLYLLWHFLQFKCTINFFASINFNVSLLSVRVPVLSLHRTSIPAISSMAVILLVMAPCSERRCEPIAIVTDKTVGMAMGIPPMRSTKRLSIPSLTVHQVSSLTEERVDSGGNHHSLNLSLLNSGAGENFVARILCYRQGLAGERGLIDLEWIAL
ncbi:hypothetical protein G2W53_028438 [Senna tora]|uniref:Uncharacterized protein n=1 Tax=Senna tora TaxID=362788 RepID=A0A834TCD1_9FABA|nr:hypothetical protein G2W53_028438 [Senna tora]